MANTRPFIWPHRRASGYVPENTMLEFRRAIELGADGVETDASITADDIVVLSHDGKLKLDGMSGHQLLIVRGDPPHAPISSNSHLSRSGGPVPAAQDAHIRVCAGYTLPTCDVVN